MSETTLVLLITAGIIVAMFAWVPLLHYVCPPCARSMSRLRRRRSASIHEDTPDRGVEAA